MTTNRVGLQLGNYRLLQLLGKGGFAEVYLGKHSYLESYAALKVLQVSLSEKEAQRFQAEAQTLVRLIHPYIVRVLDFFVEQGMPVLVMDYAPGGTLRQRHSCGSCLSLTTVVDYVSQISRALQYAHSHGIIHRDVKPENILLGAHHRLLLGDFGLALLAPSPQLFSTQELAGTLPYMAPEQLRGKPSFASDQYALGAMVYEWLCGECPFTGSYWEVIHQQVAAVPRPLQERRPKLSAGVEAVVLKALAKDSAERFSSIQAFAEALERAAQGHQDEFESGSSNHESESSTVVLSETLAAFSPTESALSLPEMLAAFSSRESGLLSSSGTPVPLDIHIFLSAPPADAGFVARLQSDLQVWGIYSLNEQKSMASTIFDHESVVDAVRGASAMVVVISSRTRSSRMVQDHLRQAAMYRQRIICLWIEGGDIATLLLESWGQQTTIDVIDARERNYYSALDELVTCLKRTITLSTPEMLPARRFSWEPRNPYKGLRAFTQDDAGDFFGRDTLVYELVETVREMLTVILSTISGTRLLAVLGPSGSGKSSVVMAGLLPRLQKDALPGSSSWVYLKPVVPGTHPLEALALAFALHMPQSSLKSIYEDLQGDSTRGLHLLAQQLVSQPDGKVVLLVDQFEEVFSNMVSEQERQQFIDLLVTAATEPSGPVIVLLTLRADYADRPMLYPALSRLIEAHRVPVLPMDLQDLRAVIEKPAALPAVQLEFEANLVGDLLFETQKQAGALPLLSFTLELLFQMRDGHVLTMQAYKRIGGVKGALAKWAEQTYTSLPGDEYRTRARAIFLRLIDPGISEQDTTRRRASLSEFVLSDPHKTHLLGETIDAFITARLLTGSEVAGVTTIEVSHEALIREWARLTTWLREAREDIHQQQVISQDAAAWQRRKRSADRLYRGSQLKEARIWAKRNMPSEQEMAFLQAGTARRRRTRVICSIAVCIVLLFVASIGLFSAQARHRNVITTDANDGPGSLREIVRMAHPGDTLRFDASLRGKAIHLQHGNLDIDHNLHILGLGENDVRITGNSDATIVIHRGVTVSIEDMSFQNSVTGDKSLITNDGNLTLNDVSVVHNTTSLKGKTGFVGYAGGAIKNSGKLILTNSLVGYNTTSTCDSVGGINNSGTLVLENSGVMDNGIAPQCDSSYMEAGGGIVNDIEGKVTLTDSIVANNWASGSGGGIRNKGNLAAINTVVADNEVTGNGGGIDNQGYLTVTNGMITHNTVMATVEQSNDGVSSPVAQGGGIYNSRTLIVSSSTVSDNITTAINVSGAFKSPPTFFSGGGIFSAAHAQLTLTNSTIANNTAYTDGGGIVNDGGDMTASFCTIYGNSAQGSGGGGVVTSDATVGDGEIVPAHLYMKGNIVAGNQASVQAGIVGEVTTDGYNLIQDFFDTMFADPHYRHATDLAVENFSSLGIDAILRDNGGQSWLHPWTHRLLRGSPAIDRIP
ncbi:MAG TPA: protein kinase, partial [Ktedonobacteraceae bacterium]|nr:protein kinase [Ktedonobacteraceae bacterium]